MIQQYFGIIEAIFVFGLAIAFYFWQSRSLKRDIAKRIEAEAREKAAGEK